MKHLRTVLSLILVMMMLLAAATLSAGALGSPPTNLYWSGATACWSAPTDSDLIGYTVTLLKGGEIAAYSTTATSYDFSSLMQSTGNGEYQFSVSAAYSGGGVSETVYSGYYDYSGGHTHNLKHYDFHYATCTEQGNKEYYRCTECGKMFWDSNADYEITSDSEVILEPYGHNWGAWETVKQPTKTEKGQERRVCAEDPDHVEYRDIPALGTDEPASTAETESQAETTEATELTEASTAPTEITTDASLFGKLFGGALGGMMIWIIIAAAAAVIIIAAVVITLVLVLRKRKTPTPTPSPVPPVQPTPYAQPVTPPVPPAQPAQPEPAQPVTPPEPKAQDDFDDHYNDMP